MIDGKEILITGGCGTLGKELIYQLKKNHNPKGIRIYSRDENKHLAMKYWLLNNDILVDNIAFIIGDVADYQQLKRATHGVNIIIHAAALKQVSACEDNPIEANRVNIIGAENVVLAAFENQVEQAIYIGTDKGVYPVNYYGLTKSIAERLFIYGSVYTGGRNPLFKVCRYGNVIGSRGSVIQVWKNQVKKTGKITITNEAMTRFFIPVQDAARFVIDRIKENEMGKIYIPEMKSIEMKELASIVYPNVPQEVIGVRPGEKLHETILSAEECVFTEKRDGYYVVHAYDMKLNQPIVNGSTNTNAIVSYGIDSYNNPDIWGAEIKRYCEVEE